MTKPLALGIAVHKVIEAIINGDGLSEAVLKGWVVADFHPEVSHDEVSELVKQAPIQQDMGETELYFRLPLSGSPSAPEIQGYIDLVAGSRLVDWKTNWQPYHVLDNHQMGLYAWAVSQLAKVDEVEGSLYFLRFQRESRHTFNHQDMERSRQWALDLAENIERKLFLLDAGLGKVDDLFPATPSSKCSHCPFVIECYRKNASF